MPTRHISPQSFDDILSDLGDDPAIPDPHGIRKSGAPEKPDLTAPKHERTPFVSKHSIQEQIQTRWFALLALGFIFTLSTVLFLAYESLKTDLLQTLEASQKQMAELKKEFAQYRNDLEASQDDLYQIIDKIEVSIHSEKEIKSQTKPISTPKTDPHELELRRWRYLGMTQVGNIQQAFFLSDKARFMLQIGSPALGDWRLSGVQKDHASIINSKGKSLILKASKIE